MRTTTCLIPNFPSEPTMKSGGCIGNRTFAALHLLALSRMGAEHSNGQQRQHSNERQDDILSQREPLAANIFSNERTIHSTNTTMQITMDVCIARLIDFCIARLGGDHFPPMAAWKRSPTASCSSTVLPNFALIFLRKSCALH